MIQKEKVHLLPRFVLACILGISLGGVLRAGPGMAGDGALRVIVSIPTQQTFVERVGGRHVEVHSIVQPGYDPHTYELTPHRIAALSDADLYVRIGVPFEHVWMGRIRSANREMRILDAHSGLNPYNLSGHDHDEGHGELIAEQGHSDEHRQIGEHDHAGEHDPHVWTDPLLVKQMAGRIRDQLIELDPENAEDFRRNYQAFAAELEALDREIRSLLAPVSNRKFMVFHPAWGYFAAAYGLTQIPIEKAGKEPTPRALTALIEQARRERIKVIFVRPRFSERSARQVARAIGGQVSTIDPLAADYVANLGRVARQIAGAARK